MNTSLYSIINALNFWSAATNPNDETGEEIPVYDGESITATTSTEKAVKTVLSMTKTKAREKLLAVAKNGSSQDKAIAGHVYHLAYNEKLDEIASLEWELLSLFDKGTIVQAVRTAVFDIEGDRSVRTPLCRFSLNVVGLPESSSVWSDNLARTSAQLDILASSKPLKGLPRVIARAVYPLLTTKDHEQVFLGICFPPWQLFGHRKGLVDVFQGYAEAFECWIEDRKKSKLGPLTRAQLFAAVDEALKRIQGIDSEAAITIGACLCKTYSFTLEEVVLTSAFHAQLKRGWENFPFGARALGALNILMPIPYHKEMIVKCDWSEGFLSRYIPTQHKLTDIERCDPSGMFKLQVEDALALENPVDRYICFQTLVNRFKGVTVADPVDPQAAPVDIVAVIPERDKPNFPTYEEVMAWREKNSQDFIPLIN
jgi:hypothetical protein